MNAGTCMWPSIRPHSSKAQPMQWHISHYSKSRSSTVRYNDQKVCLEKLLFEMMINCCLWYHYADEMTFVMDCIRSVCINLQEHRLKMNLIVLLMCVPIWLFLPLFFFFFFFCFCRQRRTVVKYFYSALKVYFKCQYFIIVFFFRKLLLHNIPKHNIVLLLHYVSY